MSQSSPRALPQTGPKIAEGTKTSLRQVISNMVSAQSNKASASAATGKFHTYGPQRITMRGSRNFRQGGWGPGQSDKKSSDVFFFFFSPQLILQKSNGQFQRNLSFFKVPEGVQLLPGGGQIAYSL